MKLTNRQEFLIANLHKISTRRKQTGRQGFFLANEDVSITAISLIARNVIAIKSNGKGLILASQTEMP